MKKVVFYIFFLFAFRVGAEVRTHKLFSSNMVLQRGGVIPIFGYADTSDTVEISFNNIKKKAKIVNGRWKVFFPKMKAGGPYEIKITGTNTIILKNVMIGDVWVCGGQSNMEFPMFKTNAYKANSNLTDNNNIRFFNVENTISSIPKSDLDKNQQQWKISNPQSGKWFSAVAYHFGSILENNLEIPIGLLGSYWGGTNAEKWISNDAIDKNKNLNYVLKAYENSKKSYPQRRKRTEKQLEDWRKKNLKNKTAQKPWNLKEPYISAGSGKKNDFNRPGCLYNAMIHPLKEFPVKGVIWYQGESNTGSKKSAILYGTLFPAMINSWRAAWKKDIPFYYVQLASYKKVKKEPTGSDWAYLRASQTKTLALKNTGMALAIDVGQENDIHPTNKKTIGARLALQALVKTYHKDMVSDGPAFKSFKIKKNKIIVRFKNVGSGLEVKEVLLDTYQLSSYRLKGFAICGDDNEFVWANAKIVGNTVELSHPQIKHPKAVRYGWSDFPLSNLYNKEGLPAIPFKTDNI